MFDGAGQAITGALVEISHVNASGRPVTTTAATAAGGFTGCGRCGTGTRPGSCCEFTTVKPGVAAAGGPVYRFDIQRQGVREMVFFDL